MTTTIKTTGKFETALSDAAVAMIVVNQKNEIMRRGNRATILRDEARTKAERLAAIGELGAVADMLSLIAPLWVRVGYGYKVRETARRLLEAIEVAGAYANDDYRCDKADIVWLKLHELAEIACD